MLYGIIVMIMIMIIIVIVMIIIVMIVMIVHMFKNNNMRVNSYDSKSHQFNHAQFVYIKNHNYM